MTLLPDLIYFAENVVTGRGESGSLAAVKSLHISVIE